MCQYCEKNIYISNGNKHSILIEKDKKMHIRFYGINNFLKIIKINYCPICGEKINLVNDCEEVNENDYGLED